MASADQMRAAWSRRSDDELLHACFLEELSPQGREVVVALVTAKVGDLTAFVDSFAAEQGDVTAAIMVRGCDVGFEAKEAELPLMYGLVVLTSAGIGFVPAGHDDELGDDRFALRVGHVAGRAGGVGGFGGIVVSSVLSTLKHTAHPVPNLTAAKVPLPLMAQIDPNAIWLPHGAYDAVYWGPDFGEVMRGDERLFACEAPEEAEPVVEAWAAAHGVSLTAVEPAPLLR